MSALTLDTANKINVGQLTVEQITAPAASAITAGMGVVLDTNGKFAAAGITACFGVATQTVAAGEALTVVRRGLMAGWSNLPAYGARVYASTAGALEDTVGTLTIVVGIVVPIWGQALGSAADKGLLVECSGAGA